LLDWLSVEHGRLAALRKRLKAETQADVRGALEAAIRCHEDHAPARP